MITNVSLTNVFCLDQLVQQRPFTAANFGAA
jgi:hypothetical protein